MEFHPYIFVAHVDGPSQHAPNRLSVYEGLAQMLNATLVTRSVGYNRKASLIIELNGHGRDEQALRLKYTITALVPQISLSTGSHDGIFVIRCEKVLRYAESGHPQYPEALLVSAELTFG